MPRSRRKRHDLHGNAPDESPVVLLIIDMINAFDFDGAKGMLPRALQVAKAVARLKRRARRAGVPAIYVNDNFGRWRSDFRAHVRHCLEDGVRGQPIAELLAPDDHDYFVVKPKHSGFYSTTLDLLLEYLEVHTLILAGFAGNICVLFTANDAYLRDFDLIVPADCVASNSATDNRAAIAVMRRILKADVRISRNVRLRAA
jgi:nicotinamidase-related amidase